MSSSPPRSNKDPEQGKRRASFWQKGKIKLLEIVKLIENTNENKISKMAPHVFFKMWEHDVIQI